MHLVRSGLEVGREKANMGGGTAKVIVGAVLISGGILAFCFGSMLGMIGGFYSDSAGELVLAVVGGLAMALLGLVVVINGVKENLKQEKKGARCWHCGSNLMGDPKICEHCGADVK